MGAHEIADGEFPARDPLKEIEHSCLNLNELPLGLEAFLRPKLLTTETHRSPPSRHVADV
jgi:hypothetical protein